MPPRDEQDYEQRRQQIIDGALAAFSEKGFDRASNKDIAQAARIASPGLIYHYFKDKVDLLHQMLEARMPVLRLLSEAEAMLDQPPEVALPELAVRLIRAYEQWPALPIIKVVITEAVRNPHVARMIADGPGRGLRIVATYMERQMDAGTLRRMDPHIATRAFLGPMISYLAAKHLLDDGHPIAPEEMARGATEIFLRGMRPED